MSAVRNDDRYKTFLELMPKNKFNVKKSAEEAGFGKAYARTAQKEIMAKAIRYQLERAGIAVAKVQEKPVAEAKKTMAEIIGFSRQEILNNLKQIAMQDKDWSTRLRVVAPLVKEFGVDLNTEEKQAMMPTLNITVTPKLNNTAKQSPATALLPTTLIVRHDEEDVEVDEEVQAGGGDAPTS